MLLQTNVAKRSEIRFEKQKQMRINFHTFSYRINKPNQLILPKFTTSHMRSGRGHNSKGNYIKPSKPTPDTSLRFHPRFSQSRMFPTSRRLKVRTFSSFLKLFQFRSGAYPIESDWRRSFDTHLYAHQNLNWNPQKVKSENRLSKLRFESSTVKVL
ncbi:MAG: hypothetical protein JWM99_5101 [Verrucomicrobiales bacterium]|nr:hypothetical protein [Verrucomicrobiales bacterium]